MAGNDRYVLITGASQGIGLGFVKEFSKRGFKVVATYLESADSTELAAFLKDNGHPKAFTLDVSNDSSIAGCLQAIKNSGIERIDILVNNAGISSRNHPYDLATEASREEMVKIYNINVAGPMVVTKTFKELLEKSSKPMVINMSSTLGSMQGAPKFRTTSYQCSKSAVNMLTKCQAFAMPNIKFVAVNPGWVQTDLGSSKNTRNPPLTVDQSVKGIVDVAEKAEESGLFWGIDGEHFPY